MACNVTDSPATGFRLELVKATRLVAFVTPIVTAGEVEAENCPVAAKVAVRTSVPTGRVEVVREPDPAMPVARTIFPTAAVPALTVAVPVGIATAPVTVTEILTG